MELESQVESAPELTHDAPDLAHQEPRTSTVLRLLRRFSRSLTMQAGRTLLAQEDTLRRRMFSGFAPLREDDDVVPVQRARPID